MDSFALTRRLRPLSRMKSSNCVLCRSRLSSVFAFIAAGLVKLYCLRLTAGYLLQQQARPIRESRRRISVLHHFQFVVRKGPSKQVIKGFKARAFVYLLPLLLLPAFLCRHLLRADYERIFLTADLVLCCPCHSLLLCLL